MNKAQFEQADHPHAFEDWADRDPLDPYRRILLEAVLEHGGYEAWLALAAEMESNP